MRFTRLLFRGCPTVPFSNNECCGFRPHCAQSGARLPAGVCAPAAIDRAVRAAVRRHRQTKGLLVHGAVFMVCTLSLMSLNNLAGVPKNAFSASCSAARGVAREG